MRDELIAFIAAEPGRADRLLCLHVADKEGRCRGCAIGGQAGHQRWPCTLWAAASAAQKAARCDARSSG